MPSNLPRAEALLLKPRQAADALAISPRKLWSLTNRGEIPHLKIGSAVRYSVEDLAAFINSSKRGTNATSQDTNPETPTLDTTGAPRASTPLNATRKESNHG